MKIAIVAESRREAWQLAQWHRALTRGKGILDHALSLIEFGSGACIVCMLAATDSEWDEPMKIYLAIAKCAVVFGAAWLVKQALAER